METGILRDGANERTRDRRLRRKSSKARKQQQAAVEAAKIQAETKDQEAVGHHN